MDADKRILVVGLYISSALYLAGGMALGYLTNHPTTWKCALASAGVSYLAYFSQVSDAPRSAQVFFVASSAVLGAVAGLHLIW